MSLLRSPMLRRVTGRNDAEKNVQNVALRDDRRAGWFNRETGELAPGFAIGPDDVFVDVGCGTGSMSGFAASFGASIIATDIDPACVEQTRNALARSKAKKVEMHVSDSNPIPVADNTATRVLCMEVMEHVDDPNQFMSELARVAKPGAYLLLTVPHPASETIQKSVAPDFYWKKPNHLRVFETEAFADLVRSSGLVVERQSTRSFFWTMYWAMFWVAGQDFGAPVDVPVIWNWKKTWDALLDCPNGDKVAATLDGMMPKSQVVLARKP